MQLPTQLYGQQDSLQLPIRPAASERISSNWPSPNLGSDPKLGSDIGAWSSAVLRSFFGRRADSIHELTGSGLCLRERLLRMHHSGIAGRAGSVNSHYGGPRGGTHALWRKVYRT